MTTTISFDRVSDIYDATRGLPIGVSEQVTDTILNIVSATEETKFFETGIGTGRIAIPIAKRGYSYSGVDISENMLAELHQKLEGVSHKLTAIKGDATSLPFADNSFDVALTVHVFHLISAWKQALAEIRRVLKPGGIYLYTHGNMNYSKVSEDVNQGRFDFQQRWQDIIASYGFTSAVIGKRSNPQKPGHYAWFVFNQGHSTAVPLQKMWFFNDLCLVFPVNV